MKFKKGKKVMTKTQIEADIENVWNDIKTWYAENAPNLLEDLRMGVSDQDISNFETRVGLTLPEDYKSSLKLHDGDVYVHDYNYLSLERVHQNWLMMTKQSEKGVFEENKVFEEGRGIIQNTWWHRGWIPFAEDGGGNLLCIDMVPKTDGVVGQIIKMEIHSGPIATEHQSFLNWLESYNNDLYEGVYEVDEDGYLIEKLS
jgi:cell wall assembly regulator SMI1